MKGKLSSEKRKKLRRSMERRGGNLRVNLFSTPKKRRRNDNFQKESFIMKLFDRSLDLSKYTENTPLYPICRAWMLNQPRNPNILSYRDLTKTLDDIEERKLKRENNGAEMLRRISKNELRGDSIVVTSLPAPLNIEVPKMPKMNEGHKPDLEALDEALKPKDDDSDKDEDVTNAEEAKKTLLANHKQNWIKIKSNWTKHARNLDKRYELNQLIIKKLYKP